MKRLFLPLTLAFLACGCMSAVTSRVDTLNHRLAVAERQFDLLSQQMDSGIAQLTHLNQQIASTNRRFEQLDGTIKGFPFFGPQTPAKPVKP